MQSKKKGTSPEAQAVINLFESLPSEVQSEFRKWINDTELLAEWDLTVFEEESDWGILEGESYLDIEEPYPNEVKKIKKKSNTKTKCIKKKTY